MKVCLRCKNPKDASDFSRDRTQKDGFAKWCKGCTSEYRREYRAKYPDRVQASRQRDMERHAEHIRQYKKAWHEQNRERILAQHKEYHRTHKTHMNQSARTYYRTKRAEIRQQTREKYAANPEFFREQSRESYLRHRVRRVMDVRAYRAANVAEVQKRQRARFHARRVKNIGDGHDWTPQEWDALCEYYDYRCLACGEQKPLTVDHIVPVSRGGTNDIGNIQPLCRSCNRRKSDKTIDYRVAQAGM